MLWHTAHTAQFPSERQGQNHVGPPRQDLTCLYHLAPQPPCQHDALEQHAVSQTSLTVNYGSAS